MQTIYSGSFNNKEGVEEAFETTIPDDLEIIVAGYDCRDYDGLAWVLLRKGNDFFEVNGSHCSCHGLEGQWGLEDVSVGSLKMRYEAGALKEFFDNDNQRANFESFLKTLEDKNGN